MADPSRSGVRVIHWFRVAHPTHRLVAALRTTANRLAAGAEYRWTHLGMCNCGHLAQTVTGLSKEEIRRIAMQKPGEWADQAIEYCPGSGYPVDHVIGTMIDLGLSREEIADLEKLRDPKVLRRLTPGERSLDYRNRDDVVRYMRAWADAVEEELTGIEEKIRSRRAA